MPPEPLEPLPVLKCVANHVFIAELITLYLDAEKIKINSVGKYKSNLILLVDKQSKQEYKRIRIQKRLLNFNLMNA